MFVRRFVNGNRRYMGPGGRGDPMHPGPPAPRGSGYGLLTPTGPPNGTQANGGCVMMVYGLDKDKVNAEKLFNIFCLYGNVIKVRVKVVLYLLFRLYLPKQMAILFSFFKSQIIFLVK